MFLTLLCWDKSLIVAKRLQQAILFKCNSLFREVPFSIAVIIYNEMAEVESEKKKKHKPVF